MSVYLLWGPLNSIEIYFVLSGRIFSFNLLIRNTTKSMICKSWNLGEDFMMGDEDFMIGDAGLKLYLFNFHSKHLAEEENW